MGLFDLFGKNKSRAKVRILVVEDESAIAEGLCELLKSRGYEVNHETDGKTGVMAAKREKPDLIIMDWTMPELNGLQACALLRQDVTTRCIPVLILTAMPMDVESMEKAFKSGTDAYMTKPYDNDQLLDKISKLLSGADAAQHLRQSKAASDEQRKTGS